MGAERGGMVSGLNVSLQNLYVEILTPNLIVFGGGALSR